ncbi:PilZ domain-containing protein [Planctomycetota bacterium]
MTKGGKVLDNYRRYERRNYSCIPIYWRKGFSNHWHHASLHDLSDSGIGLLTQRACRPKVGQMIELFCKGGENRVRCRVVRTEPWENDQILVASWIHFDGDQHNLLKRSPRSSRNRRHPIRQVTFSNRISSRAKCY